MKIKSYLENLNKEELIEILLELNENYLDVQKYFQIETGIISNESNSELHSDNPLIISISKSSKPAEKIALYKSLFIGREDVFALRWFNAKTNKCGYSPVCANTVMFLRGIDCGK